jgi:hypothetical protein
MASSYRLTAFFSSQVVNLFWAMTRKLMASSYRLTAFFSSQVVNLF